MEELKVVSFSEMILKDIEDARLKLNKFLMESDIDTGDKKFIPMLSMLDKVKVKKKDVNYVALVTDENGYIIKAEKFSDFVRAEGLPQDISKGYYKLENDEIVLDYERQRQLEEV